MAFFIWKPVTNQFRYGFHRYRSRPEPALQRFRSQVWNLSEGRTHASYERACPWSFPLSLQSAYDTQVSLLWELWNPSIASSSWKLLCNPWCTILDIVKLKRFKKKERTGFQPCKAIGFFRSQMLFLSPSRLV